MKKFLKSALIAIAALIIVSGAAYAVSNWVIGTHVTVVPSDSITVYTDSTMTEYLYNAEFGSMERGEKKDIGMFIMNNTDSDLYFEQSLHQTDQYFVVLAVDPPNTSEVYITLPAGGSISATLSLIIKPDAPFGSTSFDIPIVPLESIP